MAANKVIVNNQTILDLTADTVTAATLKKGVTAHDASGAQITGTMESSGGSTSETWVLKAELAIPDDHVSYPVDATMYSNNYQRDVNVVQIDMASEHLTFFVLNDDNNRDSVNGYAYGEWYDNSYRKLVFNVPPTGDLLTWLTANGVKQPANLAVQPSKDVTITSNGTTEITPDAPYDVMEKANLTVNVESGSTSASPKDINFYDYDGTLVAAWELSELAGKTALPDYPTHDGLTCQGWNWTLADLKAENAKMNVGAMYITSDGKTRIYITLQEGRKSPMLGVCPNGTITVDWGDGTTPNTLTGTSVTTVKWTPTHNYAAPGDYVITLTVNGTFGIVGEYAGGKLLCYSSNASDNRNRAYRNAIHRVFLGDGVTSIGTAAFTNCYSLAQITLPSGVTSIGGSAFVSCSSLAQITLPSGVTSISYRAFETCYSLAQITLPSSVTSIGGSAFYTCYSLAQITLPNGVTSISSKAFSNCYSLAQITLPSGVTSIGEHAFETCRRLVQITLPSGVTSISGYAFSSCYSLAQITLPSGVTSISGYAFSACYGMAFYDFTVCTAVPTLNGANTFNSIAADCEIRVPAALLDEWKAATNWATYASHIVGV